MRSSTNGSPKPSAKKSLGQCFLVERNYARDIVQALSLRSGETVVEIGPGRGILTGELLQTGANVVAVEIDRRLISSLTEQFGTHPNFALHHEDFLETDFARIIGNGSAKVVGNLPYHLAAEVTYKLLLHARLHRGQQSVPWIESAVLMMQREVADRVAAKPGKKNWGKLSVFAQLEAQVGYLMTVPARAFRPAPKVDGGVVRFDFYQIPPVAPRDYQILERMVRWTFSQRRKQLKTSLSSLPGIHPFWKKASFDFTRRPETLSPAEWVALADSVAEAQSTRRGV